MIVQLLNKDAVVYTYDTETKKIEIKSDFLRKQLERGIAIPTARQGDFGGRKIVLLQDTENFQVAFEEFFVKKLDQSVFHWEVTSLG